MTEQLPPWFRPRFYPHFDRRVSYESAERLVTDPARVAKHAFLPFLTFSIDQPRYKPAQKRVVLKQRPIAVASHVDAHVFAYYADLLATRYERLLTARSLGDAVLAYRRFVPPKCNIHFAHEAFVEIQRLRDCVAVAIDIESFFDTIGHDALKRMWCRVLEVDRLPPDHFAVFRAVTRFAKVDRDAAFDEFGIGKRRRQTWRGPICTPEQFRAKIRGGRLITANESGRGIPQGSPISAVLSNIFMLDVDEAMQRAAVQVGGIYRRYSDDVLLIAPPAAATGFEQALKNEVAKLQLEINDSKTKRSVFAPNGDGVLRADKPLQYLGFLFDGERILVRPQTLARYIRRMKAGVKAARRAAIRAQKKGGSRRLRRQELFARFSHLGPTTEMLAAPGGDSLKSNFWSYAIRAGRIIGDDAIRRQIRRHWPRLVAEIEAADAE